MYEVKWSLLGNEQLTAMEKSAERAKADAYELTKAKGR